VQRLSHKLRRDRDALMRERGGQKKSVEDLVGKLNEIKKRIFAKKPEYTPPPLVWHGMMRRGLQSSRTPLPKSP
jgi:hypothetical protein